MDRDPSSWHSGKAGDEPDKEDGKHVRSLEADRLGLVIRKLVEAPLDQLLPQAEEDVRMAGYGGGRVRSC